MAGQTEDAEEITVVERRFVLVTHKRQKYRCACNGCVDTAPGPLRLAARPDVGGRRYAPEFAVEVAIGKYGDHLPLERQARIMRREGLDVASQTLWDQIEALATALQPTYKALHRHVLAAPVIGADETWWRVHAGARGETVVGLERDESRRRRLHDSGEPVAGSGPAGAQGYGGIVLADGYGAGVSTEYPVTAHRNHCTLYGELAAYPTRYPCDRSGGERCFARGQRRERD